MPAPASEPGSPAWHRPLEWLREEKLWRDVVTRVIAGVVTAAVVYAGALLLGYLHTPELGATALLVVGIGGAVLLLAGAAAVLSSLPPRVRAGRPVVLRVAVAVVLVLAAGAVVAGVVTDLAH
jgi:multisubunit Na+/H+ antiporter MnhB subunit